MKTSIEGVGLIKEFEGCKLHAYPDPGTGGDPWTIGIGTTKGVKKGMVITESQAIEFLERDLAVFEAAVSKGLKVPVSQPMFDAMISLCYNIGAGNFAKSSVLRLTNAGDKHGAADAFLSWNKAAGHVMAGLTRRRQAERALYLKGV